MKQIFIENFRIDVERCEVHKDNATVSLEPKVLQVFLYLVKHQGEVVPHQALLDEIWPNTVVEANALQRCIGQLRKAFNDDAKQQRIIATYPKNGYSLVTDVHLSKPIPNSSLSPFLSIKRVSIGLAALLGLLFITFSFNEPETVEGEVELITTSFDFYAIYSPDGRYVIYPRQADDSQEQHLWLQNLTNDNEVQLTAKSGKYRDVAWSPNSRQIAFIENSCIQANCFNPECSSLKELSISNSSIEVASSNKEFIPTVLLPCEDSLLQSPQWINEETITYIRKDQHQQSLMSYNLSTSQENLLFQKNGIQLQHLTYSPKQEKLAFSAVDNQVQQILLLETSSSAVLQLELDYPDLLPDEVWLPMWNPQQNALLLSVADEIFTIELNGSVRKQSLPFIPAGN